ncbi:MAG: S8 family serine peptidase, partial [Candidatus Kapaibacterium sp.]
FIGGSVATLFFCLLLSNSVFGQQINKVDSDRSAKLIAFENHGLLPDLLTSEEVVGGALYIKLSESAAEGNLTATLNELFANVGLRLEAATPMVVRDQLLSPSVKSYRSSLSGNRRSAALNAERELSRIITVSYANPVHPRKAAAMLSSLPGVEYAEPVILPRILSPSEPNDPRLGEQTQVQFINADEAWKIWPGDSSLTIGIIDAGITARHEDLWENIAPNYGEAGLDNLGNDKSTNGIDDDNNGYVDDWKGVNLTAGGDGSAHGNTENGEHGTQVSGYAAAATNNDRGIAGIANQCRFFPVKAARKGSSRLIAGYEGIIYCAQQGFQVINCSWGSTTYSRAEQDIIENVTLAYNATVVAAGGNDQEYNLFYPAGYRYVLGVGGVNSDLGQFVTTWGEHIDITATAGLTTSDLSLYYDLAPATSYTTPVVSGIVALVRSRWPEFDARQAAAHVRLSTVNIDQLNLGKEGLIGTGRADALQAISTDPFSHPALVIDSVWAVDESGNRKEQFTVGEKGRLMLGVTNLLGDCTNAELNLRRYTDDSAAIRFDVGALSIGTLGSGESWITQEGIPFEILASSSGLTKVRVDFQADGYTDYAYEVLRIYRPYTVYSNSRIAWTLTDRGRIGFDRLEIGELGEGVLYNDNSHLFEGGLIIAEDRTHVLDNVRNTDTDDQNNDFRVVEVPLPANDSTLSITDSDVPGKIGLEIRSHVRFVDTVQDALGMDIYVKNVSGRTIDSLRVGFFGDWDLDGRDVGQSIALGSEFVPGVARYGLVTNPGGSSLAIGVAQPAVSVPFFAINNNTDPIKITDDFNKEEKWNTLANGIGNPSVGPADISLVIGEILVNVADQSEDTVTFILSLSENSLFDAVDGMARYANARTSSVAIEGNRTDLEVMTITPNPAGSQIEITLPTHLTSAGTFVLNDVRGDMITSFHSSDVSTVGRRLVLSLGDLSSGLYYLTYQTGEQQFTTPLLIVR